MNISTAIAKVGNVGGKLVSKTGKLGLLVKAKSPELLIGGGILLVIGGTVMACRATSRAKDIINDYNDEVLESQYNEQAELALTNDEATMKEIHKEARSDIFVARVRRDWKLTKLYAPAIAMEVAGIGCFLGAHDIMRKRNSALIAAYEATDAAYRKLQERYNKDIGETKRLTESRQEASEMTPEEQKIADELELCDRKGTEFNRYSFFFDEMCDSWTGDAETNKYRALLCQQLYQKKLDAGRVVTLNDIRTFFGEDSPGPCAAGQVLCWSKELGDTTIDLGLTKGYDEGCRNFINGRSREILITPNCHNLIYKALP